MCSTVFVVILSFVVIDIIVYCYFYCRNQFPLLRKPFYNSKLLPICLPICVPRAFKHFIIIAKRFGSPGVVNNKANDNKQLHLIIHSHIIKIEIATSSPEVKFLNFEIRYYNRIFNEDHRNKTYPAFVLCCDINCWYQVNFYSRGTTKLIIFEPTCAKTHNIARTKCA